MKSPEISGKLLAHNMLLNLIGQGLPLLVGVVSVPFIIRGLGTDRFGLLSLAWVVLGYFAIFDLGLGRATTKFVAEALGKGEEKEIPRIAWTSVTVQALFGLLGSMVLIALTPLLVGRILNVPPVLIGEAKVMFYILAPSVPIILISSSFQGILEAFQRFDLVTAVKIPSSTLTFLLPLLGLYFGFRLPGIVMLTLLARIGALLVYIMLDFRIMPQLRKYSGSLSLFPHLFSFGGWVTVTNIVGPILVYLDRFLIGSLLSMASVAYYSAPYEMVTRLSIISTSLSVTLFPAFSSLEGVENKEKIGTIFARSVKYILLTLGPVVLIVMLFARDILGLWLGTEFLLESTIVLQVLALGVLINSLAHTPFALLQGVGRPDLPAKFHLFELLIYIGIAWLLVSKWGINGAAMAWTLRVTLDTFLLFGAVFWVYKLSSQTLSINGVWRAGLIFVILAGLSFLVKSLTGFLGLPVQILLIVPVFGLFGLFCWRYVIDTSDRRVVVEVANSWINKGE